MASSINTTKGSSRLDFLKTAAKYVGAGTIDYFAAAMPVTSTSISEAKSTISDLNSRLQSTMNKDVLPFIRQIKGQASINNIMNWFVGKSDEYNSSSGGSDNLNEWDDGTTASDIAEDQMSEAKKNANQISGAIIDSIHKSIESQISMSSNILAGLDKQAKVISAGFDKTNENLAELIKIMTRNTAAMIETTSAMSEAISHKDEMVGEGKFNLSDYKNIVKSNLNSTDIGMVANYAEFALSLVSGMISGNGTKFTPKDLVGMGVTGLLNKFAPKIKGNLRTIDNYMSDAIMASLIRLGENTDGGIKGTVAKLFGIDSSRNDIDTERSSLSVKSTSFDTITRESIVSAIPGYLRKILVAVGGEDTIYDYKSRSFKSKHAVRQEFLEASTSNTMNSLSRASDAVRNQLGTDSFSDMMYDLMMNNLSSRSGRYGDSREVVKKFTDPKFVEAYAKELLGDDLYNLYSGNVSQFAKRLSGLDSGRGHADVILQAAKNNANRNSYMARYMQDADLYEKDLSFIKDSSADDHNYIKSVHTGVNPTSEITDTPNNSTAMNGLNYTNMALYEIYRRLNEGLNVFWMGGNGKHRKSPFAVFDDSFLPRPDGHSPKPIPPNPNLGGGPTPVGPTSGPSDTNDSDDNSDEDDTNTSKWQRFAKWGGKRGSQFMRAIVHGSPADVKQVLDDSITDISKIAGDSVKNGISMINSKFGNISGHLGHKIFGNEYTYTDTDSEGHTIEKTIQKNEKGGVFGFVKDKITGMFNSGGKEAKNWFSEVAGYFDYKNSDKDSSQVVSKRKKLISASVGAMAGAGILGGPVGLLMGAVAGNALSGLDIGDKFKDNMFGTDENGKPTGLFSKAADAMITPIEYQFKKTASFLGDKLKKNIFGPLSDLGLVIRERVSNKVSSIFGKFFQGILNAGKKLFGGIGKLAGKLFEGALGAEAGMFRAKAGAVTSVAGFGINRAVDILTIGQGDLHDQVKNRREQRNSAIKDHSTKFGSLKDFKQRKYDTNKNQSELSRLEEYTAEQVISTRAIEDINSDIATNTEQSVEILSNILDNLSGNDKPTIDSGSEPVEHAAVSGLGPNDSVPNGIPNEFKVPSGISQSNDNSESIASSAIVAGTVATMSSDSVTNAEYKELDGVYNEASGDKPSKSSIRAKLKSLIQLQRGNAEDEGEKKSSLWNTITGFIGSVGGFFTSLMGNLPTILAVISGLWMLLKNPESILELFQRLGSSVDGIFKVLGGDPDAPDSTTAGMNAITSIADAQVEHAYDWATPLKSIYHNDTDANGNRIVNNTVTDVKERLLWQDQLKSELLGIDTLGTTVSNAKYEYYMNKAQKYNNSANKYEVGSKKYNAYSKKRDNALDTAGEYDIESRSPENTSTTGSVARNIGRVGTMYAASGLSDLGVTTAFKMFGASDNVANIAGDAAGMGMSAYLTYDFAKSAAKGKTSKLDHILNWVTELFNTIATKIGADKKVAQLFEKVGQSKVVQGLMKLKTNIERVLKEKVTDQITDQINARLAKAGVTTAVDASVIGAIILMTIGGISGLADGICGVEHLFNVLPGDADATMYVISSLLKTALGVLEMSPYAYVACIIDIIDMIFTAIPETKLNLFGMEIPIFGAGLTQMIARLLYAASCFGGVSNLAEKQAKFEEERQYQMNKYGYSISPTAFNDAINNTGWLDALWKGSVKTMDDGHLHTSKAGEFVSTGGIRGLFVGSEKDYLTNDDGSVIRDSKGKGVELKDYKGNTQKVDKKWGDSVGEYIKDAISFFTGRDLYETDENDAAVWDAENNQYVVNGRQRNILDKLTDFAQGNGWAEEEYFSRNDISEDAKAILKGRNKGDIVPNTNGSKSTANDDVSRLVVGPVGSAIGKFLSKLKDVEDGVDEATDDNSTIVDEDGNEIKVKIGDKEEPIKYKDIKSTARDLMDQSMNKALHGLIEISDGIDEWEEKSPWANDGERDPKKWIGSKLSDMMIGVTGGSMFELFNTPADKTGVGGPVTSNVSYTSLHDGGGGGTSTVNNDTSDEEEIEESGGNPLINKGYKITSPFGTSANRPHSGMHKGVDLIPSDNSASAEIGARFSGKILSVKDDVPDSVHAVKVGGSWQFPYATNMQTGNMVTIQTDDGMVVKNMHLKAGSIPSNIKPGARVSVGDRIGTMGSTGWSTGNHLHYEFRDENDQLIDPTDSLDNATSWKPGADTPTYDPNSVSSVVSNTSIDSSDLGNGLSGIINYFKTVGNNLLYSLTGGLIGSDSSSLSTDGSTTVTTSTAGYNKALGDGASLKADDQTIWNYLKSQGLSDYATAGLMGNLYAESGLRTNNLQDSYEKKLGSDDEYTSKVNSGEYMNFANDSAGYGLAQWTSSGRKAGLYQAAVDADKPIDSPEVQLDYLMKELNSSYKSSVLNKITNAKSVKEASDVVLHKFEVPKDQSSTVENKRAGYGQTYYNEFAETSTDMRMGGADATNTNSSTIKPSRYTRNYSSNNSGTASNSSSTINSFGTFKRSRVDTPTMDQSISNAEVVQLLKEAITELRAINGNTGNSTTLLRSIGENGIVDKGLRNELSSIQPKTSGTKNRTTTTSYRNPNSGSNNRMISSMIRP